MKFKDKNISIIGMARTGIAAANFLAEQGAHVTLLDGKTKDALGDALQQLASGVNTVFQSSTPLPDADLVILSPGMDIDSPDLNSARESGTEIISELELAYRVSETPIIAITGTNGKSTTTSLIGHLLEQGGKDVRVGGNIGVPFVSLVKDQPRDYMVLEISSFQLEGAVEFHPQISVILNITPDHLDRHKTIERYAELKERIAANQTQDDVLVLNHDDPWVHRIAAGKLAQKWTFSMSGPVERGCYLNEDRILFKDGGRKRRSAASANCIRLCSGRWKIFWLRRWSRGWRESMPLPSQRPCANLKDWSTAWNGCAPSTVSILSTTPKAPTSARWKNRSTVSIGPSY